MFVSSLSLLVSGVESGNTKLATEERSAMAAAALMSLYNLFVSYSPCMSAAILLLIAATFIRRSMHVKFG